MINSILLNLVSKLVGLLCFEILLELVWL